MGEVVRGQSGGAESLTRLLVTAIAEKEDVDPIDLAPPLNTAVDVDALEELFDRDDDGFVRVEFTYAGRRITIAGDETIQIDVE